MTAAGPAALLGVARAVLLDFDGPVCSIFSGYPAPVVAAELAATAAACGHPVPDAYRRSQDPLDVFRFAGTVGPELTALIDRELTAVEVIAAETAEETPGATRFLVACSAAGKPVAVVSNNSAAAVLAYLALAGLTDLVRLVEGRDPADPGLMKPHPNVVRRSLGGLGVAAESAVMVGDSVTDIEAGVAAGVRTVGYANKPGKSQALRACGADLVLESMDSLAEAVAAAPEA